MKKAGVSRNPITSICLAISICCSLVIILSLRKLPEVSQPNLRANSSDEPPAIGKFGGMMIELLPDDLPFTVFLPSDEAFGNVLKLKVNESLTGEQLNDTQAVLSRVLGFSAVPRAIYSAEVPASSGKEVDFDSLSGFRLCVWKEEGGRLVVNRVKSISEDYRVRETIVHIMDGVIMDADFEQSFREEDDED
uniref:FAS1 domain-containing protein n=1 Tax=Kalanchoe fedtschenkoi TaxID=63787 RepID=A0A7N0UAL2_KALFE